VIEVDNCLQCVAFHPTHPALVAAGSFNGEVYVWDLSAGDGLVRRGSTRGHATPRGCKLKTFWRIDARLILRL